MVTAKLKPQPKPQPDFKHAGPCDRPTFQTKFTAQFAKNPRHNAAAVPDRLVLLGMIERDTGITDVREAA